jgi:hypothetical protein
MECSGGENRTALPVADVAEVTAPAMTRLEIRTSSTMTYASTAASAALTMSSVGFERQDSPIGFPVAGATLDIARGGDGIVVDTSSDMSRRILSTKAAGVSPAGRRVHCTVRNRSGTIAS